MIDKLELVPHAKSRSNYNSHRIFKKENFQEQEKSMKFKKMPLPSTFEILTDKSVILLSSYKKLEFEAHKEPMTSICFIKIPEKHLLTTSIDKFVKIFNLMGMCLCKLNINHP